jgi:hypothetical protein
MRKEVRARRQVLSPHWSSTAAAAAKVVAAAAVAPSPVSAASSRRYGALMIIFTFCQIFFYLKELGYDLRDRLDVGCHAW